MRLKGSISNKISNLSKIDAGHVTQLAWAILRNLNLLRDQQRSPNIKRRGEVVTTKVPAITNTDKL